MAVLIITPMGANPPTCECCGEWIGASKKLKDSVRRHSGCANALARIQEIAFSDNPDIKAILDITLKTIGDVRD